MIINHTTIGQLIKIAKQTKRINLLVPVQGNIGYNPSYRSVLIRNPYGLVKFINKNSRNTLYENRILEVVKILQR